MKKDNLFSYLLLLSFQAAESGNLDDFARLFQGDNTRLSIRDGKGRTAAHQAAARNRVNILQFIRDQQGGMYLPFTFYDSPFNFN